MEVSSTILKRIVKECCRSLHYNDVERQFSFPLKSSLEGIWNILKYNIQQENHDFFLSDFNHVLSLIVSSNPYRQSVSFTELSDSEIMVGEILNIKIRGEETPCVLVKMKHGQYLRPKSGDAISLGSKFIFRCGKELQTSEGIYWGECSEISILKPSRLDVAISGVFLKKYFKNRVSESIWPIYNMAKEIVLSSNNANCEELLRLSEEMGINSLTLTYILKGACNHVV